MDLFQIIWNHEPGGNVEHIADNDLTPADCDAVLTNPFSTDVSDTSELPMHFGYAIDGRYIAVIFIYHGDGIAEPVTAYKAREPRW